MAQTKRGSFIETVTNTAVGFVLSMVVWHFLARAYGIPMPIETNLEITGIFTVVSILRGFVLRRVFNQIKARWNAA